MAPSGPLCKRPSWYRRIISDEGITKAIAYMVKRGQRISPSTGPSVGHSEANSFNNSSTAFATMRCALSTFACFAFAFAFALDSFTF